MRVVLSPDTQLDLAEIGAFIATDSSRQAIAFVRQLRQVCAGLGDMPNRFPAIGTRAGVEVRRAVEGNYSIFYSIEPKQVYVIRILHSARDHLRLLSLDD